VVRFNLRKQSEFSSFLKKKRNLAGLSQKEVSEQLGYSTPQFISNWERGMSTPPITVIKKIASLYKISIDEIFDLLLQETVNQVTLDLKRKFYGKKAL
jgi:transcriptional regulator with XRE-family HTH domain